MRRLAPILAGVAVAVAARAAQIGTTVVVDVAPTVGATCNVTEVRMVGIGSNKGKYYCCDGTPTKTWSLCTQSGTAGNPAGVDQDVQVNVGGSFGAVPGLKANTTTGAVRAKIVNGTKLGLEAATGGSGTTGSPYTGWQSAIAANSVVLFTGNPDGTVAHYDVPDAGVTIPSDVVISGDGKAVFTWGTTRASVNPMFTIPAGTSRVRIENMRWEPGVTVPATGLTDGTGGAGFIYVGTAGSTGTVTDLSIVDNQFGVARYSFNEAQEHIGTTINVLSSLERADISHNSFDTAPSNIIVQGGHASAQYVFRGVTIDDNRFHFTQSDTGFGFAVYVGSGAAAATVENQLSNLVVSNNSFWQVNGTIGVFLPGESYSITGNTSVSDYMDGCVQVMGLSGTTLFRSSVVITGNACSSDTTPHNGSLTALSPQIAISGARTGAVHGNSIYGNPGFALLSVANSQGVSVVGNSIDADITAPSSSNTDGIFVNGMTGAVIADNILRNIGDIGIDVQGTTVGVALKNNHIVDTNAPVALALGVNAGATCATCSVIGTTFSGASTPASGIVTGTSWVNWGNPTSHTDLGFNFGYTDQFDVGVFGTSNALRIGPTGLFFEGAGVNAFETNLWVVDPTHAQNDILLPDQDGTVAVRASATSPAVGCTTWELDADGLPRLASTGLACGSGGDVAGPASSAADELAAFNGTTGKIIKSSGVTKSGSDYTFPGAVGSTCTPGSGDCGLEADDNTAEPSAPASGKTKLYPFAGDWFIKKNADGTVARRVLDSGNFAGDFACPSEGANCFLADAKVEPSDFNATNGASTGDCPTKAAGDQITWAACGGGGSVSDTAYDASTWDGVTSVAPSKNAVRDKFESLVVMHETSPADGHGAFYDTALSPAGWANKPFSGLLTCLKTGVCAISSTTAAAVNVATSDADFLVLDSGTQVQVGAKQVSFGSGEKWYLQKTASADQTDAILEFRNASGQKRAVPYQGSGTGSHFWSIFNTSAVELSWWDNAGHPHVTGTNGYIAGAGSDATQTLVTMDRLGTDATIRWNETDDRFQFTHSLELPTVADTTKFGIYWPVTSPVTTSMFMGAQGATFNGNLNNTLCWAYNADCAARVTGSEPALNMVLEGSYDSSATAGRQNWMEYNWNFWTAAGATWRPHGAIIDTDANSAAGYAQWFWTPNNLNSGNNRSLVLAWPWTSVGKLEGTDTHTDSGFSAFARSMNYNSGSTSYGIKNRYYLDHTNSVCTASGAPLACCTGAGTGTCENRSGPFVYGFDSLMDFNSTGSATAKAGWMVGGKITARASGSQASRTVDAIDGLHVNVELTTTQTGNLNPQTAIGVKVKHDFTGQNFAVWDKSAGLWLETPGLTGAGSSVANHYGLLIDDQRFDDGITNGQAIRVAPQTVSNGGEGNVVVAGTGFDEGHVVIGTTHLWEEVAGTLRTKSSAPTSDGDGAAIVNTSTPVIRSMDWNAGMWSVLGTCATPSESEIPTGVKMWKTTCTDADTSQAYGSTLMPDGWDAGAVRFTLSVHHAASEAITCLYDVTCQCVGDGEAFGTTFTTEAAATEISITTTTLANQMQYASQSGTNVCTGTCAAGDVLRWELEVDATGSGANCANTNLLNLKMEYTRAAGND